MATNKGPAIGERAPSPPPPLILQLCDQQQWTSPSHAAFLQTREGNTALWAVRISLTSIGLTQCLAQRRPSGALAVPGAWQPCRAALRYRRTRFSFSSSAMTGGLPEEMFELAFVKVQFLQVIPHTCDTAALRA